MLRTLALMLVLMVSPVWGYQKPTCVVHPLTDQEVKEIVDKERAKRADLPAPFSRYTWVVQRQGCYYVYIERGLPEAPDYSQFFKLNQHGVIVDTSPGKMKCPEKVLTESELTEIVIKERAKQQDLPAPFSNYRKQVDRTRCLYIYFEYALPERKGNYQAFTIDPFGEVMGFFRSKPY